MLAQLAASGHHGVAVDSSTPGGWTLLQHSTYQPTLDKIKAGPWDDIVLQDQSYLPALPDGRDREMDPGARVLDGLIRQAGAKPLLYMTWGRQKGLPEQGFADFDSMQTQLTKAYTEIGQELNIPVVPAGLAWKAALGHDPALPLWGPDGSHPSVEGTYLTACVFYAVLYQQSPLGLTFTAGLPPDQAKAMQAVAAQTVLINSRQWNIR